MNASKTKNKREILKEQEKIGKVRESLQSNVSKWIIRIQDSSKMKTH